MADDGKRSENLCAKVTERMALDLLRVAAADDRSPSEYIYLLLRQHLYGCMVRTDSTTDQGAQVYKVDQGRT